MRMRPDAWPSAGSGSTACLTACPDTATAIWCAGRRVNTWPERGPVSCAGDGESCYAVCLGGICERFQTVGASSSQLVNIIIVIIILTCGDAQAVRRSDRHRNAGGMATPA